MYYILNQSQMLEAEESAVKRGDSFSLLMEKAGKACAKEIKARLGDVKEKNAVIFCGKGKNGGDGFVIARALRQYGFGVKVVLCDGEPTDKISLENYEIFKDTGGEIITYNEDTLKSIIAACKISDIAIDAIYGTGFKGEPRENIRRIFEIINCCGLVFAVDVPSGAGCDGPANVDKCVKADITCAISAYKPVHIFKPFNELCGEVVVADIGITEDDYKSRDKLLCFTYSYEDIEHLRVQRVPISNKGTYGTALIAAGSKNMTGAAYFAISAALRSGVGLVRAAIPDSAYLPIVGKVSEPVFLPSQSTIDGYFSFTALADIINESKRSTACLLGCGIGYCKDTQRLTTAMINQLEIPMVLDADALNCISTNPEILKQAKAPIIITPHPGEMSRLTKLPVNEILKNPISAAYSFARRYNVTVVLKTANTVICSPEADMFYVNCTGNAGLAKGGSGDLLAGLTVGMLAQGMKPFDAACCATYLHGYFADRAAEKRSMISMLPSDVLDEMR